MPRTTILSDKDPRAYRLSDHVKEHVMLEVRGRSNEVFTRKQVAVMAGVTPQTIGNKARLVGVARTGWAECNGITFREAGRKLMNMSPANRSDGDAFDPAMRRTWRKRTAADACATRDEAQAIAAADLGEARPRCRGDAMPINPNVIGAAAPISHAELPTPRDLKELGLVSVPPYQPIHGEESAGRQAAHAYADFLHGDDD